MKRHITLFCALLSCLLLGSCQSCDSGWTPEERNLINAAAYSRMRVTQTDNTADSLLLRCECLPLSQKQVESLEFGRLVASMIETVNDEQHGGVGIAAPQVGILRRVVAVQRIDKEGRPFEIYVNPVITSYSDDKRLGGEGCLSVPGVRGVVERASAIELEWRDAITYELRTERIEGFTAVIFQHEIDHLNGILYTDRASKIIPRE